MKLRKPISIALITDLPAPDERMFGNRLLGGRIFLGRLVFVG
jgi:hypothetical protein